MSSVNDLTSREERPPYVSFERRPVENIAESKAQGRYIAMDVDFALVTPPYSKDCVVHKVSSWLEIVKKNVRDGRTPQAWLDQWQEMYKRWKNGQEMPINGTPIKGWGVISPSQQEMLIQINCRTVEDLADVNDEGMRRIGIGSADLKQKAKAWLASMKDHGVVTRQVTELEKENAILKASLEALQNQVDALKAMIPRQQETVVQHDTNEITASELLEDDPAPKRRGRPPKQQEQEAVI